MIFLTGSTGTVGSAILRKLVSRGDKVKALVRNIEQADIQFADIKDKVDWAEGDILDVSFLHSQLVGIRLVIHAAALVSFNPKDKHRLLQINVEGTSNVVNAALANGVEEFCHLSSVAALGRGKTMLIDESSKWENSSYNSAYAGSKYLAEIEVWRGQEEGLKVLIVNPSVILGGEDWTKSSAKLFKFGFEHTTFYTEGSFNYVDLRDVVSKTIGLLDQKLFGQRVILNSGEVSFKEFFQKVALGFEVKPPTIKVNKVIIYLVYQFERLRSFFTGSNPLVTRDTAMTKNAKYEYDNSRSLLLVSGAYYALDDSIQHVCTRFVDKYSLKA